MFDPSSVTSQLNGHRSAPPLGWTNWWTHPRNNRVEMHRLVRFSRCLKLSASSCFNFLVFCGTCWSSQRNVLSEHWSLKSSKKNKKTFDLENLGPFFARKAAACRYWTWTLRKRISRISNRKSALVSSDRWKMMVLYIVTGKGSGWFRMMDGIFLRLEGK